MEILSNLNMVTMSSSGQTGGVSRPSMVSGSSVDAGPSAATSGLECQNVNNCHQNSTYNNNSEEFSDWNNLLHDSSKMSKIRDVVENNSNSSNKCVVDSLLQQINQLSDVEKLLLYLKLPVGKAPDLDPLKQPLNALGSRREIQLTITWMKTHLELDVELSLPKEEVYKEYMNYSKINSFKALSTADFGKVMKQVFPDVKARRLGQRGASKYCHSGLKKTLVTQPPSLPELNLENSSSSNYHNKNTLNSDYIIDERDKTAESIIFEYAEKMWKIKVDNLRDLALHLIDKNLVNSNSGTAFTILSMDQRTGTGKHRETQYQLHKTLKEREQKRKLQEQQHGSVKSSSDRPKTRKRSGSIRNTNSVDVKNVLNSDTQDVSNNIASTIGEEKNNNKLANDTLDNKTKITNIKKEEWPPGTILRNYVSTNYMDGKDANSINNNVKFDGSTNNSSHKLLRANSFDSKSQSPQMCQGGNNMISQPNMIGCSNNNSNKNRYKPIQPKGENNNNLIGDNTLSPTGIISSCAEDDNRLMHLPRLREILVEKLPQSSSTVGHTGLQTNASFIGNSQSQIGTLDQDNNGVAGERRRVSFQTSVDNSIKSDIGNNIHLADRLCRPSIGANTNFSRQNQTGFITFGSQGPSQASSANASPFVSPRGTPLPRSRHNSGQTSSTYVTPRSTPAFTPDVTSFLSENSSPFMSPAPTPYSSRTRHNSSQNMRSNYAPRTRNLSGAPSFRHTPYSEDNRRAKCRSRHSSGSIPPSPQSAPLSPHVQDSSNHILGGESLMYQHQQQQFKNFGAMGEFSRRRHMSADTTIHYHPQSSNLNPYNNASSMQLNITHDQEVSNVMTNPNSAQIPATNRPQSVPLPTLVIPTSVADFEAKSHPTTPLVNDQFHFGPEFFQSYPSSYAPTPVPSELNDFTSYSDLDFDTDGLEGIDPTVNNLAPNSTFSSPFVDSMSTGPSNENSLMASNAVRAQNAMSCADVSNIKMDHQSALFAPHPTNDGESNASSSSSHMTLNAINANVLGPTQENIVDAPLSHLDDEFHIHFDQNDDLNFLQSREFLD